MADELTPLAPTILSERLAVTEAVVEPPLIPQVVTEVVASTIVVAEDPGANTPFGDKVFANADNAENLKNHLTRELDWLSEPMRINAGGGIPLTPEDKTALIAFLHTLTDPRFSKDPGSR
jgi:hypothetical protein